MNCSCGMNDRRRSLNDIFIRDHNGHCQRLSPLQLSDLSEVGFELAQKQSSDFVEWSRAVVLTTTQRHYSHMDLDLWLSDAFVTVWKDLSCYTVVWDRTC